MVSLKELRRKAAERLAQCQNDSPAADIDFILMSMGFSKSDILLGEKTVEHKTETAFWNAIERLECGEPVQYIVGGCEFMSLWFDVNHSTLIPRSDTEILVEEVIELCKDKQNINIFEIGSGSGCIAISLAYYMPQAKVVSADISADALAVATQNAQRLGVSDRVTFIRHDITKGFPELSELPDVVVSNPPYIPNGDIAKLDKKVKDFEPLSALDGGDDGLDFYRLISDAAEVKAGGYIAFEVGIGQAQAVAGMLSVRWKDIKIKKDLSGIERVVTGRK